MSEDFKDELDRYDPVTRAEILAIMEGRSQGDMIACDDDGTPVPFVSLPLAPLPALDSDAPPSASV